MATPEKIAPYLPLHKKLNAGFNKRAAVAVRCEDAMALSICWLGYFYTNKADGDQSSVLLDAAHSAAIEVTSSLACGLMRSALFSLRNHYELFLMYLFYRDHPVEWKALQTSADEWVKLPKEIKTYLKGYFAGAEAKAKIFSSKKTRSEDDPYFLLSAFAHGGKMKAFSIAKEPADTCYELGIIEQFPLIASDVSEYLSDIAASIYSSSVSGLPTLVRDNLEARIGSKAALAELYS